MADEMEELFGSEDDDDEEDETSRIQSSQTKTTSTNDSNKSSSEMNELFGSDNEENEENDEEANMEKAEVPNLTSRLSRERTEMTEIFGSDVDEDDDAGTFDSTQDTVRGTEHATICISETTRLSGDPKMVLKLPHFIKIQTTPFSKDTYDADAERQAFAGATAVIRWRYKQNASGEIEYDDSGKPIRESNSRMVKYSDGSFAILIGDEVFECNVIPVRDTYMFCHRKSAPPEQGPAQEQSTLTEDSPSQTDVQHQTCLECVGQIHSKVHLQPSSVTSTSHELMSLRTNERYRKLSRLKRRENFLNAIDPEKEAEVRAAAYGEDIKRERKRQLREEGSRQKTYGRRMSRGEGPAMRAAYLQEGLEDDSRYDSVSVRDIKRGVKANRRRRLDSEGEEEEDDEDDDGADMGDFIVNEEDEGDGEGAWGESEDDDYDDSGAEEPARQAKVPRPKVPAKSDELENATTGEAKRASSKRPQQFMASADDRSARKAEVADADDDDDDDLLVGKVDKSSADMQRKRAKRTIMDSDDEDEE